jgi:ABC-2 type transport system permease protein
LALHLDRGVLVGWLLGVAATGACFGVIAELSARPLPSSTGDVLDKFGVHGTFVEQYLGIAFLMMAAIVALLPASLIGAAAEDETTGRLANLIAQPTQRAALFSGRLTISVAAVAAAGVGAGLATWAGARARGIDVGFATALGAGVNLVPTALVVLGVGALVRSIAPRRAGTAVYGVVAWSFVADLFGSLVEGSRWLRHLSVFDYMALVPAETVDTATVLITLAVAAGLLGLATVLFTRHDLQTG